MVSVASGPHSSPKGKDKNPNGPADVESASEFPGIRDRSGRKLRRRDRVAAPADTLSDHQSQTRRAHRSELHALISVRPDFAKFTDRDIVDTADLFALWGISAVVDIENIRAGSRDMAVEDLRDEGYRMLAIQLVVDILNLPHPMIRGKSPGQHKCEEVNFNPPRKMRGWTGDLRSSLFLANPVNLAADAISGGGFEISHRPATLRPHIR